MLFSLKWLFWVLKVVLPEMAIHTAMILLPEICVFTVLTVLTVLSVFTDMAAPIATVQRLLSPALTATALLIGCYSWNGYPH